MADTTGLNYSPTEENIRISIYFSMEGNTVVSFLNTLRNSRVFVSLTYTARNPWRTLCRVTLMKKILERANVFDCPGFDPSILRPSGI